MGSVLVLTTAPTYRPDLVGQDALMLIAGKQGGIEGDVSSVTACHDRGG